MLKSRLVHLSAFALLASAPAALSTPLLAQGSTMRLAFGYQCGDNFVVHNDGTQPADLQYAVVGSRDQSSLHLNGGESVTITSPANDPLQLWVNGKVVATEPKGGIEPVPRARVYGSNVIVRPLNPGDGAAAQPPATTDANAAPLPDGPPAYDYYPPYPYPYYYPYYPYAYYGGYPYLYGGPLISIRRWGSLAGSRAAGSHVAASLFAGEEVAVGNNGRYARVVSRAWMVAALTCCLSSITAGQAGGRKTSPTTGAETGSGRRFASAAQVPLYEFPSDEAFLIRTLPAGTPVFLTDPNAAVKRDSGYVVALDAAEMQTKHGLFIVPTGSILRVVIDTGADVISLAYRSGNIEILGIVSRADVDRVSLTSETWVHVKTEDGTLGYVREQLVRKP